MVLPSIDQNWRHESPTEQPRMLQLTDLPNDILSIISSHLPDLCGVSLTSKVLRKGASAEIDQRMIESFVYFRALGVVCLSRRMLLWHAQCNRSSSTSSPPRYRYRCRMCTEPISEVGGCESCQSMVRKYPWMHVAHRALPTYLVRMFHSS